LFLLCGIIYKFLSYLLVLKSTVFASFLRPLYSFTELALREQIMLDTSPDGILWIDEFSNISFANPATYRLSTYHRGELEKLSANVLIPGIVELKQRIPIANPSTDEYVPQVINEELILKRKDGVNTPVGVSVGNWNNHSIGNLIVFIHDLSERKNFEDSLQYRASHDLLTDLPNRWLFNKHLKQSLREAKRSNAMLAVVFLDLDDFKTINDTFGHGPGDQLLINVSQRLKAALRKSDILARLGGDEFAVLITELSSPQDASLVAQKLIGVFETRFQIDNFEVVSGGSLGIALFPDDAQDGDGLMRCADSAMYQAKRAGRGSFSFYSSKLSKDSEENHRLHVQLKAAIESCQMSLHYQPQCDVSNGQLIGAEALLRWFDPQLGEIPPGKFIPVAEATGLILLLSEWVIGEVCRQISYWLRHGESIRVAFH
ncbi:MAG: diguanylate cyclase, partial [Proteobacteria bacterium]|nr:diguanylate cyclase [Pseudomonadota bacterium]